MPGKLILKFGDSILGEYPLDKETLTIGRKPNNDITVENLAVSGQHARVITILQDSFLEDLNSTNGSYVNGKLIHERKMGVGKRQGGRPVGVEIHRDFWDECQQEVAVAATRAQGRRQDR